ncbi:MAG: cupredoxin domain-containing protein [Actinomycetota bacterium]
MNQELRERTILPVLIPVLAIVVTEIFVFSMSRVLLAAGEQGAVVIALGTAIAILVGAAAIAAGKRVRTSTIVGVLVLLGLVSVAAGALAIQRGPAYLSEEAADRPALEVAAADLTFDTDTLELSSGGAVIEFQNADSQPHNIAIYPSEASLNDPLFRGEVISAGQSVTYEVPAIRPGEYYFQCDVHPTMKGTAEVVPAGPPPEEG